MEYTSINEELEKNNYRETAVECCALCSNIISNVDRYGYHVDFCTLLNAPVSGSCVCDKYKY